jgi:hypothetical protein
MDPAMQGDARDVFSQTLLSLGFSQGQVDNLIPQILQWQSIYTPSQIVSNMLPTTDVYKQRFAGNDARVKAGLPPLDPASYVNLEQSYSSILRDAGLPKGFYDSQDDFAKFIAGDVSPTELQSRVQGAAKAIENTDPYYKQALQEMYGLSSSDMIAHMLDPDRAMPLIEKQVKAVEYGTAAARQGLQLDTNRFENLAGSAGVTGYSAEQGFGAIAQMTPSLQGLAQISGDQYDQQTAEQEVFGGLASAKRKREQLVSQEQQRFAGGSGISSGSLGGGTTGAF